MTTEKGSDRSTLGLVSFVLPVFDEEGSLHELHRGITAAMSDQGCAYEVVFVDDGSTDRSFPILCEIQRSDERVRVLQLRRNFGKAAAYSAGFDHAKGDIVITMDADLQDDPADIPRFLDRIAEGVDVVNGWKHEGKTPWRRAVTSRIFNSVVRFVTDVPLHDFNCPFKAYRREVLREISVYGELHRYIPVLARARGFTLAEIKVSNRPRRSGRSKFGPERHVRGLLDLLTIIFITRFAKRPMHLLGLSGIGAWIAGFGILLFLLTAGILHAAGVLPDPAWDIRDRPMLSLGILLMVVGVQFFSIGLLGELFIAGHGAGGAKPYSVRRILGDPDGGH
jgi:glycosyltransferase involved in cell wall biosynthesis